jgi:hypothetical protein
MAVNGYVATVNGDKFEYKSNATGIETTETMTRVKK